MPCYAMHYRIVFLGVNVCSSAGLSVERFKSIRTSKRQVGIVHPSIYESHGLNESLKKKTSCGDIMQSFIRSTGPF